jgi:hypothetical protein
MKLALLAILFVPFLASAATSAPAQPEPAKVVSELIVGEQAVLTYFNETTEQVCTYAASINSTAPSLTCVSIYTLSDDAQQNVRDRAAAFR